MNYTISNIHPIPGDFLISAGIAATVTLDDGTTFGVSHVEGDPDGVWGIDSAFSASGHPAWCNGEGARYLNVKTVSDEIARELDLLAHTDERTAYRTATE